MGQLRRAWAAWKRFGEQMAIYFGMGLFAVLWVVGFAPIALVCKLMRKRFLPEFKGNEPTYYGPKEKIQPTMEFMRRQGSPPVEASR